MGPAGPEPGSSGALDLPEPELSNLKDIAKVGRAAEWLGLMGSHGVLQCLCAAG